MEGPAEALTRAGDRHLSRLVLGGSALGFAALSQYFFWLRPPLLLGGFIFAALAVAFFILAGPLAHGFSFPPRLEAATVSRPSAPAAFQREPWRLAAVLASVILTALLLWQLPRQVQLANYNAAVALWITAIALTLVAVVPWRRPQVDWGQWWHEHRLVALLLASIVLVASGLRLWQLGSIPPTLSGDEGSFGIGALSVLKGEIRNPFATGWEGVPTMSFYVSAPTINLLGNTSFALRLPWALVGSATVLVVFWLVARLYGQTLGLVTAGLLATSAYHIHFSRLGLYNAPDPFFVALALLFLYRARDRRSPLDWGLCGVVTGLAQYSYPGARYTAVIVGILTISFLVRDRAKFWHEQRSGILILLVAATVTAAPMIQYATRFPAEYNARLTQIGILQSGWLEREQVSRHQGAPPILIDQFQRAALAYNAYPDREFFYHSPAPLFDFAAGGFFLLGLGAATVFFRNPSLFPMVAWWWGAILLGGALTVDPPSSQRLLTTVVPAVFFVALALVRTSQIIESGLGRFEPRRLAPHLAGAVIGLSLISVKWYFVDFTPTRVYGSFNAVVATALGGYEHSRLGPNWRVYFFGAPRMYYDFATISYLAPDVRGVDVRQPLVVPPGPTLVSADKWAAFVFLPERVDELDLVRRAFPQGQLEVVPSPLGGAPLFIVFRVTGAASPTG